MEDNNFQKYYNQVRERDQQILDETPLPEPKETNVWALWGLGFGVSSMFLCFISFFSNYDLLLGIAGLALSLIAQNKKESKSGFAGMVCSIIGIVLAIIMISIRTKYHNDYYSNS